jgi:methionyl-tRNA formyltransferase
MNGDEVSGASVMVLTEGMDEGPVLSRLELPIAYDDSTRTYGERLARDGASLLVESVSSYLNDDLAPEPQDDSAATYAPKLTTDDARIDWSADSETIHNLVRALDPEPGAWTTLAGTRVKVFMATPQEPRDLAPGQPSVSDGLYVGTGDGAVRLDEVQPATKRRMPGPDFARGLRLDGSERMGE